MKGEEFDSFFAVSYPRVFRAAYAMCGNYHAAEEATQEAFARCLARWSRLRSKTWTEGWVMTTTFNELKRAQRRGLRIRSTEQPMASPEEAQAGAVETLDLQADVRRAILSLPPRERQAVILFYFGDYPTSAVAQVMRSSEGSVRSQLSTGRQRLLRLLDQEDQRDR